jgi:hypothetical protein
MECRQRKWLKVEESGRLRELLGKDEVFERDREASLSMQPAICDDGDVVVGRDGFKHGDGDGYVVLVFRISLTKNKGIAKEDHLAVDVFNNYDECFCCSMNLLVPTEIWDDRQIDPQQCASDWLNLSL